MASQQPEDSPKKKTSRTEAAKDAPSRLNPERSYASPNWGRRKLTGNHLTQEDSKEDDDPFHAPASDRLMNLFLEVREPLANRHGDHREIQNADNTVSPTRGLETGRDSTDVESLDEREPGEIREGVHAGTATPTKPPTPAHNGDHDCANKTPGKGKGRALDEHAPVIHHVAPMLEAEDPRLTASAMDVPHAHLNAESGSGGADAALEGNTPSTEHAPAEQASPAADGEIPTQTHAAAPPPAAEAARGEDVPMGNTPAGQHAMPNPHTNDAMEQDTPGPDGLAAHYGSEVIEAAQAAAAVQAAGRLPDPHPFAFDNVNQAMQAQRDAAMEDIAPNNPT
ncbi:hypothetical protein DFH07DRAFT_948515 [Mycena maculata]|uniref:Uncharacterized protein n=1 Tax=Mycena maculata TaxID=230809 RepID=A0AAD7P1A4_9AGAR|nr:hypothetical protein DFH07DRAFT_948515 [Mycena maculata]